MAQPNVGQGSSHTGAGDGMYPQRVTAFVQGARDLQIVDSTISVVGGDVHNHYYHVERSRDLWAILRSIPNFRNIYQDMLSKATSGTGMWLVKGDKFRVWLEPNGDIKIFWGSGIPGAGKTLLASIVIEHLDALCQASDAPICVCYVFFRYSERADITVRNILEILVKQTLERHADCLALAEAAYARHLRENTEPTEAQLLALLRQLTEGMKATFYILDALDEAPTKIQFAVLKALTSLNVKLFITSRPLETLRARFPQAQTFTIVAQDVDLDLHIAKEIDGSADLQHLLDKAGPWLREEIVSTIKKNCGGMFLHASLQLEAICECVSAHEVTRILKAFPSRIEDVYLQTWDRIRKQGTDQFLLAKAVLVWVVNASRSMTMEELERAIATSPETHIFESHRMVPGAIFISLCRGLITVEEESNLVRLVHYTAKDTLQGLLHESYPHPHSLLAAVCMTHLAGSGFQNTTISSEEEFEVALKKDPLLAYSCSAWAFHAREGMAVEDTKRRTACFVRECRAFPAFTNPDHTQDFDILASLHVSGLYNLPLVEDVATHNPNATTPIRQQSPLTIASWSGHLDFVANILALSNIQVNLLTIEGWSALMRACLEGHEGIVELLLAYPGIQVNLIHEEGLSALMVAAHAGHEVVVKLLLTHPGIQVNLVNHQGWSALLAAVRAGHEGVVRLILEHPEIQGNQVNDQGFSALMLAAKFGFEGLVKTLLSYSSTAVNMVNIDGWSALMVATHARQEGVVRLLLADPTVQVNPVSNDGWSAVMLAASEGYENILSLLLAYSGTEVNLVNGDGCSALMLAARWGWEDAVKLLLAQPAIQINQVENDGWSALMLAVSEGCKGVVKLLLAAPGIQVDLVSHHGSTALLLAAQCGYEDVVKLLLDTGAADANAQDRDGDTAIKLAAEDGYEDVVRLLLDVPDIDITIRSPTDGHTAMSAAEFNGHSGIVGLLRDFGLRMGVHSSTLEISLLKIRPDDDGLDSDSSGSYHDAEEGPDAGYRSSSWAED